jgi:cyanophycinase
MHRWFSEQGFEPIYVPLTIDNVDVWARDRLLAEQIASCDAVYLAGGDQAKHVRCLLETDGSDTPVLRAIRSVAEKGGLVSGSSAGAAAQGRLQYGEGDVYGYLVENRLIERAIEAGTLYNEGAPDVGSLQRGLGLLRDDALVCTHFDQRYRLGRLLVALGNVPEPMFGIGVDEDTGLFVRGSRGRVVGSNGVFVIDPSEARYGAGPNFEVDGVRLTYLTHGDQIDLDTRHAEPNRPRVTHCNAITVDRGDILSPLAMTKLIEEMIRTGAERAVGTTDESEPRFVFELRRDSRSRAYDDGERVSAVDLILSVGPLTSAS